MVEEEDGVGADELLDEERRRADLARRVLDGGLAEAGAGVVSRRCSGELRQVDRL
jgi:hypothetical protein